MRPFIEIPAAEGTAEAVIARPDAGSHPGVLLFIDAIGLRQRIQDMADRIASWGYIVLAPNTMYRSGTAAETTPTTDLRIPEERAAYGRVIGEYLAPLTGAAIDADLPHYIAALRGIDGVSEGPIGVTGYCMGAKFATRAAGLDSSVAACGGFHGAMIATSDPDSPHHRLVDAQAAFVYGHADNDDKNPPEDIARLDAMLTEHGLQARTAVYPDAPHGFTMSDTSSYQEVGAERHFTELRELFDATLGA
ncbi:dienelactone hydrolase family protein [Janibacter cremeus]|uniref:dienelactone hydrolase family protein n=1 Tax=Janibacter cremeus TaxID=1285192 RepID=UPI0023F952D7|nr:dienelactone hydrolase family protein [Janibacter cremeus]WEV77030.1 dienelactone hydrolase family protein [Janibacter cremeus]